jgi:hypothetical protein
MYAVPGSFAALRMTAKTGNSNSYGISTLSLLPRGAQVFG